MECEQKNLISELSQGKELTEQLRKHLNPSSSSFETRLFLVEKILSSYEKALSLLTWVQVQSSTANDDDNLSLQPSKKKRKTQHQWTEQVRVCSGTEAGPPDDGYNWRKYGQKDILGANFPRGYFRCSHRHSQGCVAIKQVQRSDKDPSTYEVTYIGKHTCVQSSRLTSIISANRNSKQNKKVKTEDDLEIKKESFPSIPFAGELNATDESNNFATASVSPTFMSSVTSESNYFSASSYNQLESCGFGFNVQTPESDFIDIISAPNSISNSPIGDVNIPIFNFDVDTDFQFDNLDFFA